MSAILIPIPNKDGKEDFVEVYNVLNFPYETLNKIALKAKHKKRLSYIIEPSTFDIETTTIHKNDNIYGYMYIWQMCVAGYVCIGRTWGEWREFIRKLKEAYEITIERRLVIYVHNLAYEYEFIRCFLSDGTKVFATKPRKPLYVTTPDGMEFRCSYMLTNMTLEKAVENEAGTVHRKAVGDLDYRVVRTPTTALTTTELGYCVADVVTLYELIKCKLKNDNDNLESIPMTSTGYVRRDCRRYCRKDKKYRREFLKLTLSKDDYIMLKEAGRGGNTHANRYLSGRIMHNVDSYDVASSYPAQMVLQEFPMTKFVQYGEITSNAEFTEVLDNNACLFRVALTNVALKQDIAMPYLPISKMIAHEDAKLDNGRILSAKTVYFTCTDIDWKIIEKQYNYDKIIVKDMRIAKYGRLPQPIIDCVMDYFRQKSELKYKIKFAKTPEEKENYEYLYTKAKNRLNGIFGMMYSDIVHELIEVDGETLEWKTTTPDIEEAIAKFYKSRNSFLYYAWGVWITARARAWLETLLEACGGYSEESDGEPIYCDTDSSKCVGVDPETINALNDKIKAECDRLGAYADVNGTRFYMGIYEKENKTPICKFKTLGAKKYVYEDDNGLHITIAGVSKQKNLVTGVSYAVEELKKIENFDMGFTFRKAGGLELHYNDVPIHTITVNGEEIETASNIGMTESTYTIGITREYSELIGFNIYDIA